MISEPSSSPIVRPRTGRAAGIDVGSDLAGAGELGLASGVGVAVAMGAWVPAGVGVAMGVAPGCRNGAEVGAGSGAVDDAGDGDGLDEPQPVIRTPAMSRTMTGR